MAKPEYWVFEILVIIASFFLTTGLAYCIFMFERKEDRAIRDRQELSDQFYRLGRINQKMTNATQSIEKSDTSIILLKQVDEALADCLFEIWHLAPSINDEPLLLLCNKLENLLNEYRWQLSEQTYNLNPGITLDELIYGGTEAAFKELTRLRSEIYRHESKVRDAYREWLGKPPLTYVN